MAATPFARSNIGDLSGRIALITGASSGIGRMIAQAYAAAGAFVVSGDITPDPPKAPILAGEVEGRGTDITTPTVDLLLQKWPTDGGKPRAIFVNCDVTNADSLQAAVKATVEQYGRLDIMVNNAARSAEVLTHEAGVIIESTLPEQYRLHETSLELFDKTMSINVRGVYMGCKYAITQMLAQEPHPSGDRGWIINISSIFGLVGSLFLSSYCTSKGAVTNLTRVAALEYAESKIHVNSIHPGYTDTPLLESTRQKGGQQAQDFMNSLHPWGRIVWPEDVAKVAVFLAGDGASCVTGQQFVVDGGYIAR